MRWRMGELVTPSASVQRQQPYFLPISAVGSTCQPQSYLLPNVCTGRLHPPQVPPSPTPGATTGAAAGRTRCHLRPPQVPPPRRPRCTAGLPRHLYPIVPSAPLAAPAPRLPAPGPAAPLRPHTATATNTEATPCSGDVPSPRFHGTGLPQI